MVSSLYIGQHWSIPTKGS